ncbi:hypothetical protein LGN13_10935 [Burkholderia multivorans]|nr:hypothetical protein [Burkholderia multivorans]
MSKTLTDPQIIEAFEREIKNDPDAYTRPGETVYQITAKELVRSARALLATQQPEPRASASFIAAAIAVIKAARAHVLTDEHIDALDIAIKIQQGMFKVPEPRDEVTDERIARLREAIEGECDGLAVDYHHARAILEYVDGDAAGTGAAS